MSQSTKEQGGTAPDCIAQERYGDKACSRIYQRKHCGEKRAVEWSWTELAILGSFASLLG